MCLSLSIFFIIQLLSLYQLIYSLTSRKNSFQSAIQIVLNILMKIRNLIFKISVLIFEQEHIHVYVYSVGNSLLRAGDNLVSTL